jgi:RNA polymerase sigma factor (sigma-70 family)
LSGLNLSGYYLQMDTPDSELLRRYCEDHAEAAFSELVHRHLSLVYATALRQTRGDSHCAKDICQAVFSALAQKAPTLLQHHSLGGWLYITALYTGGKIIRSEHRRRGREKEASAMQNTQESTESNWTQIEPLLDDSMRQLDSDDREILVLRYFEKRELKSVGESLGISDEAARKRINRAVAKLRKVLVHRGALVSEGSLTLILGSMLLPSAPAGFATGLVQTALASAGTIAGGTALAKIMAFSKLKSLSTAAILLLAGGTALFQTYESQKLKLQLRNLESELTASESSTAATRKVLSEKPRESEVVALRADQKEAIRLRALAAKLQLELKSPANPPASKLQEANQAENEDAYWVRKFTAKAEAQVPRGQSLLTGGWQTEPGKRTFVLVTPTEIDAVGNAVLESSPAGQVTIETWWIEVQNSSLSNAALIQIESSSDASNTQKVLSKEETQNLLSDLKKQGGVDLLSTPKVTTLFGRQARISVEDAFTAPSGHQVQVGPTMDIFSNISDDKNSFQLTVNAELALKRSERFPEENDKTEAATVENTN